MGEPIASFAHLTARITDAGGVEIDYGDGAVAVNPGDRLVFEWGGAGPAAISTTPFALALVSGGKVTELYNVTVLDEVEPDYMPYLNGLRAFIAAVGAAVAITIIDEVTV